VIDGDRSRCRSARRCAGGAAPGRAAHMSSRARGAGSRRRRRRAGPAQGEERGVKERREVAGEFPATWL
jgi:hypothetical protein